MMRGLATYMGAMSAGSVTVTVDMAGVGRGRLSRKEGMSLTGRGKLTERALHRSSRRSLYG